MRHARADTQQVGTTAQRIAHGHGRANTEAAGLVTGCGDDAAIGGAADDERFAAQLGIVALLNGRVESVHVDMQYAASRHALVLPAALDDIAREPFKRRCGRTKTLELRQGIRQQFVAAPTRCFEAEQ